MRACFGLRRNAVAAEDECCQQNKLVAELEGELYSLKIDHEKLKSEYVAEKNKNHELSFRLQNVCREYEIETRKKGENYSKKIFSLTSSLEQQKNKNHELSLRLKNVYREHEIKARKKEEKHSRDILSLTLNLEQTEARLTQILNETRTRLTQKTFDAKREIENLTSHLKAKKHSCHILARDREIHMFDIASLTQELETTKERLVQRACEVDKLNLLLEKEQQNCRILSKELCLTQQRFLQEQALRVDGAAAVLVRALGDLVNDPISLQLIEDPFVLPSGNTIGSKQIAAMKARGYMLDPCTRQFIGNAPLYKNLLFGHVLDAYREFLNHAPLE